MSGLKGEFHAAQIYREEEEEEPSELPAIDAQIGALKRELVIREKHFPRFLTKRVNLRADARRHIVLLKNAIASLYRLKGMLK